MRIGGQKVDPASAQQLVSHAFGRLSHLAENRARRDLDQHAAAQPVVHPLGSACRVGLRSGWVRMGVSPASCS